MVLFYTHAADGAEAGHQLAPLRWPYLAICDSPGKGRGVFTTRDLPKGALIERAPVLIVPEHHRALADKTMLFGYLFLWEHNRPQEELYEGTGRAAIALGVTSLVNHSDRPNARLRSRIEAQEIELRATRDIDAGEEILIDYDMTLWFTPAAQETDRAA